MIFNISFLRFLWFLGLTNLSSYDLDRIEAQDRLARWYGHR